MGMQNGLLAMMQKVVTLVNLEKIKEYYIFRLIHKQI